jgi:predicted Ser/Thr protein kinase
MSAFDAESERMTLYIDTVLFILGGVLALFALVTAVCLGVSRRRSRAYRKALDQDTEIFDVFTATANFTGDDSGRGSGSDQRTASLDDGFGEFTLGGRYRLKTEIHGGGMSRVFIAENVKLGNQWIVKFISNRNGYLASEERILKLLNHNSLPKIVDIFHSEDGVFLVETFVEGVTLDKLLAFREKITEAVILDWMEQMALALNYLHKMTPSPVYHFDIKPSNIMVTHDNRLVLIDFGISRHSGEDGLPAGVTYFYAAPEQLKHRIPRRHAALIRQRFGELPARRMNWNPDARTDIYSLGAVMFEMAVGQIAGTDNINVLQNAVSSGLCEIIGKCLAVDPERRYRSAEDLLTDIREMKGSRIKMARTLFARKLAAVSAALAITASGGALGGGYYVFARENAALVSVDPEIVTVSLQQSGVFSVEKKLPDGKIAVLEDGRIQWSFSRDNVARVDGNRVSGLNVGETKLTGRYRQKEITMTVRVVEPLDGMVNVSQRYESGHWAELLAGTAERDRLDGSIDAADFMSPESAARAEDGTVYVADSGTLRVIWGDRVGSVSITPDYITVYLVRCYKNSVYILSNPWEDTDGGFYYGIVRLTDRGAEGLYIADARYTAIEDFAISDDGLLYFIDRSEEMGGAFLKTMDLSNVRDIHTLCKLPAGTSALALAPAPGGSAVYLANPETGVIQIYREGELGYFAGIENERAFVDGAAPLFYAPRRIRYADGFLYVWDFNVLRRIEADDGVAGECMTLAGVASPVYDLDITDERVAAEDVVFPYGGGADFVLLDGRVLLTDPKHGVIWEIR